MSKKLGIIRKSILNMKLRSPTGVQLSNGETTAIIDIWREDQQVMAKNTEQLEKADQEVSRVLKYKLPEALIEVTQARGDAARFFKITKDPLKKREWARRLVVADDD